MYSADEAALLKERQDNILQLLKERLETAVQTISQQKREIIHLRRYIQENNLLMPDGDYVTGLGEDNHQHNCNAECNNNEKHENQELEGCKEKATPMLADVIREEVELPCQSRSESSHNAEKMKLQEESNSHSFEEADLERDHSSDECDEHPTFSLRESEKSTEAPSNGFDEIANRILKFEKLDNVVADYGNAAVKLVVQGLPEVFWLKIEDGEIVSNITESTQRNYQLLEEFLSYIEHRIDFFEPYIQSSELANSVDFPYISSGSLQRVILAKNGGVNSEFQGRDTIEVEVERDLSYVSACFECPFVKHLGLERLGDFTALSDALRSNGFRIREASKELLEIRKEGFD